MGKKKDKKDKKNKKQIAVAENRRANLPANPSPS